MALGAYFASREVMWGGLYGLGGWLFVSYLVWLGVSDVFFDEYALMKSQTLTSRMARLFWFIPAGMDWDEPESLILAQSERWRHA